MGVSVEAVGPVATSELTFITFAKSTNGKLQGCAGCS